MVEEFEDTRKNAGRKEIRGLIQKQEYKCALTGMQLEPDTAEIDHVVPVADGGDHSIGNLQILHKVVNRMKGSMSNAEFISWCKLVSETASTHPAELGSSRN